MIQTFTTQSEAETIAVGRELAPRLSAGSWLLLYGDLGAGKTAFVRGLAEGLGVPPEEVSSPTFTLIQEYRGGRVPLLHVDLYRLSDPREIDDLGLEELGIGSIVAIEWSERMSSVPDDAVIVRIEHAGDNRRLITVSTQNASTTYSDR